MKKLRVQLIVIVSSAAFVTTVFVAAGVYKKMPLPLFFLMILLVSFVIGFIAHAVAKGKESQSLTESEVRRLHPLIPSSWACYSLKRNSRGDTEGWDFACNAEVVGGIERNFFIVRERKFRIAAGLGGIWAYDENGKLVSRWRRQKVNWLRWFEPLTPSEITINGSKYGLTSPNRDQILLKQNGQEIGRLVYAAGGTLHSRFIFLQSEPPPEVLAAMLGVTFLGGGTGGH